MHCLAAAISLDDLGNLATIVVAVATVALFLAAIWAGRTAQAQIAEQRRIERRRRAYDHLTVFNGFKFARRSYECQRIFKLFQEEKEPKQKIWEKLSDSEKVAVQTVMNFYEETAHEYNAGFLDRKAAAPLVFVAVVMWQPARALSDWLRAGDRRFGEQWEKLYDAEAPAILRPADLDPPAADKE